MGLCCLWASITDCVSGWPGLLLCASLLTLLLCVTVAALLRLWVKSRRRHLLAHLRKSSADGKVPLVVGFFHPYCNAGGGGERVLWTTIRALQNRYADLRCVVYTGDIGVTPTQILDTARQRFNITLPRTNRGSLEFVFLRRRGCVEAHNYPVFTLLGQALGSVVLGFEALFSFVPDVYVDTMGYAFTLPVFRLVGGCLTAAYVHYPTVSTDMLARVRGGTAAHNNAPTVARSRALSAVKVAYYRLFAVAYGRAGRACDVVMANSTWTRGHVAALWGGSVMVVYPPCDTAAFAGGVDDAVTRRPDVVSVAQFRPEKQHALQLRAFRRFLDGTTAHDDHDAYRLVLVGGCRDDADVKRVDELRRLCDELKIADRVVFDLNASFTQLRRRLAEATIGLHTMWNEHFGIGVVECMAAGAIVLAHDSAGPKLDIVRDVRGEPTGFLAEDEAGFADAMAAIFAMTSSECDAMRGRAREQAQRFSVERFELAVVAALSPLMRD